MPVSVIWTTQASSVLCTLTLMMFVPVVLASMYLMLLPIRFMNTSSSCFFAPTTWTSGSSSAESAMSFDAASTLMYSTMDSMRQPTSIFSCVLARTVLSVRARRTRSFTSPAASSASAMHTFMCVSRGCFFAVIERWAYSAASGV